MSRVSRPITVSQLSAYIKSLFEKDRILSAVSVAGELSNYKIHSSGHHYFTLKDDGAVINAVMFRSDAARLRFRPESGMKVVVTGRISLFPKSGQYQIYASSMQPEGKGDLQLAYEKLREKLYREGLFDERFKKPLPKYPTAVALVTSPTGAAVRDMCRVLTARWPAVKIIVCPVKVQGEGAAQEIAAMIALADRLGIADVIITGRGGGSIEDLWAFNEEIVARAIFACRTPVISAVGHEPDVTIADYVADKRAATPSNGAELAVSDHTETLLTLDGMLGRMTEAEMKRIRFARQKLNSIASRKVMQSPYEYLNERRSALMLLSHRAASSVQRRLNAAQLKKENLSSRLGPAEERLLKASSSRLGRLAASLDALSPLKVLSRGFAAVSGEEGIIKTAAELEPGRDINVRFSDGSAKCSVKSVEKD